MIFIGGISQGQKALDYVKTVICSCCGSYGRYEVIMTYMYFSFFFIPLFKWNRRFYVKMTCCNTVYELDPQVGMDILKGRPTDIAQSDLTLVQKGEAPKWQKTCGNCGYSTEEEFDFCPKCGKPLR